MVKDVYVFPTTTSLATIKGIHDVFLATHLFSVTTCEKCLLDMIKRTCIATNKFKTARKVPVPDQLEQFAQGVGRQLNPMKVCRCGHRRHGCG